MVVHLSSFSRRLARQPMAGGDSFSFFKNRDHIKETNFRSRTFERYRLELNRDLWCEGIGNSVRNIEGNSH